MWTHAVIALTSVALTGVDASPFARRAIPEIPGYNYTGCYTEASGIRALSGLSYFEDLMTVQKCAAACAGFNHFGVEYGRECYCGNTINTGSVLAPAGDCSFSCPGDLTQDCGAGNRLNLYTRAAALPSFTSYGYRGCFSEPVGARALPNLYQRSATNMTIEACASFCIGGGYTLFGLEYYEECFCSQRLTTGTLPAPEADCRFPCTGNSQQICGGDSRLNVYEFGFTSTPGGYISEGCYTEATGIRALSDFAYYNNVMTVALCANACAGYNFFGVEYGRECFCGNRINTANGSTPTAFSECSFDCPGNPAEKCGAGNRLNLYRYLPAPPTTTSVSTSSSSTATSLTFSTSTTSSTTTYVLPSTSSTTESSSSESSTSGYFTETSSDVPTSSESSSEVPTSTSESTSETSSDVVTSESNTETSSSEVSTTTSEVTTKASESSDLPTSTTESETPLITSESSTETSSDVPTSTSKSEVAASTPEFTTETSSDVPTSTEEPTIEPSSEVPTSTEESTTETSSDVSTSTEESATETSSSDLPTSTSESELPTSTSESTTETSSELPTSTSEVTSESSSVELALSTSESSTESSSTNLPTSTSKPTIESSTSDLPTSTLDLTPESTSSDLPSTSEFNTESSTTTALTSFTLPTPSSSSPTPSSSSTTTSSPPLPPTNILLSPSFESTPGPSPWTILSRTSPRTTFSFTNPTNPHSGLRSASISYTSGSTPPQAWFNQPITLRSGTRYIFSGWTRASVNNPGCSISFFIGTANGTTVTVSKTLATVGSSSIRTSWRESEGFFDTPGTVGGNGMGEYTFNVRVGCSGGFGSGRTFYVDDLNLVG
ncbi:WSC domain-containing protein [Podospora fimiseda]|uniref:WSC domain-containing protein n=1 Tax=Podospora fimiseda TaxID=252190 RepID=A0AAN6YKF2_9PEZI|nr:WSC domain-containing protein [Podospora fimiseda]